MKQHVLVIGAGIIGACIAYELARAGQRVTLLEAASPAAGITRWCPGGVRQQWGSDLNILLVRDSLPFFNRIAELDAALHFERCGYIFLSYSAAGQDYTRQLVERQQRLGVNAQFADVETLLQLCPSLNTDGLLSSSYGPDDGFVNNPVRLTQAIVEAAQQHGAALVQGQASALLSDDGRITGVQTDHGPIYADTTVLAAGQGARALADSVGLELPLHPEERRLHYLSGAPEGYCHPFLASSDHQWAGKQLGEAFYMSRLGELPPDDETFKAATFEHGARVLNGLEQLQTTHVVHGFYSSTPDFQAIVDVPVSHPGLILSVGFNGNGFMMAPANARMVTDLVLEQRPQYDFTDYRLDRFKGQIHVETAVI
ncbi:FAD-binding oxidoreductase (plasmid) [Deinococcus psychrotolerans]|uniref:FAD-binding oxidoreductase n=1 Tax=Deinococcus psychrotolerans TaxID=2489213 RepID=A0A3G8YID0_9DEIO|nr:FAD-binding oxidoreductase [Deinococcus psychrotolerans]AZI45002.1 FAD-binding oxidoreductase [Deinococcus psychrotolerans]